MDLLTMNRFPDLESLNYKNKLALIREHIVREMTTERMDFLLELLLDAMSLVFVLNNDFRKNIDSFRASYTFRIGNSGTGASVIFAPFLLLKFGRMIVKNHPLGDSDVSVTFADGKAMAEFLFSPSPDIFAALLDNRLSFTGNLNYLFKFAYMAKHLPKSLGIELPA